MVMHFVSHRKYSLLFLSLSIVLFILISICLNLLQSLIRQSEKSYVNVLLEETELMHLKTLFENKGVSQLTQWSQISDIPELPAPEEHRLQRAAHLLQQRLILRQWLAKFNLLSYYSRLLSLEVTSLEDVYWLEDSKSRPVLHRDFVQWSSARQSLPISKQRLETLKADLWSEVVKSSSHQDAWAWGGMLVVSISVAGLITLAAMTQPSLAPEAKHSLLQYVTGKYLLPSNCKVLFHWSNPHTVGHTFSFTVEFFQRNGNPYPICDTDNFNVDVQMIDQGEGGVPVGSTARKITLITELGSAIDPNMANRANVKFTVRHSGRYRITIMVGSQHVAGSPFTRHFLAGPAYAQRTVVTRHCSTVVCTANVYHILHIEPRDEFGNICCYTDDENPVEDYSAEIQQLDNLKLGNNFEVVFDYDWANQRIKIQMKFSIEGYYHSSIKYRGMELQNGDFDIIVLNMIDATLVYKNVSQKNNNICYESKLISINNLPISKPKKVLFHISPKQLIIKELFLKFIPKRLYTFRLCPSTKISYQIECSGSPESSFVIEDGCQPKIELVSRERNVIAATFAQFLLKNIGGSETFKDKEDFFYHEVRQYHQKHYHEKLSIRVNRQNLLESSMRATKSFSVSDWCRNFDITFQGEQAVDWGGVRREWFELICSKLFDSKQGLFCGLNDSMVSSNRQALVHPNPNRPSHLKIRHYEFAGRVVGKCLYESALGGCYRQLVRARFTRSFLAQVIGLRVHYRYFEQDDPDLYLSKIKYLLDNDIDVIDAELYFVEEQYDGESGRLLNVIELVPNGSKLRVKNTTKLQYLDALAQYRLSSCVREEIEAFLKGLNELIPDSFLSIFDENELELLLCGTGEYSIADFKAHHVINGNSVEFRRIIGWFWAAVGNFTQEEMARLLQFTTGCSQLPPGGFKELTPRFQITAVPTIGNLPTAHTCFNQLCLPDHDTYEKFEKALLLAINEGAEGFGMV